MNYAEESLRLHEAWGGKIEVTARVPVATRDDLSLAYTPGVARLPGNPKGRQPVLRPDPAAQPRAVVTDGSPSWAWATSGPRRYAGDGGQMRAV